MHPVTIKQIRGRIYGGEASGTLLTLDPRNLSDINLFFREALDFVGEGKARLVELTLVNHAGLTEVRKLYSEQESKLNPPAKMPVPVDYFDDPFATYGD